MFASKIQGLDAVARSNGRITMRLEKIVEELHVELVVFHNQDGLGHPPFPSLPLPAQARCGQESVGAGTGGVDKLGPISCGRANFLEYQEVCHSNYLVPFLSLPLCARSNLSIAERARRR